MMKKNLLLFVFGAFSLISKAQNPGLVISEILPNPAGTDSPFEWVELVATASIDFSVTPYTVVVSNNGTATTNGWIQGAGISYGFAITTGTVAAGDVVYIGGTSMAPTGTKLRVINTGTTAGDGFGNLNASGVVGNGTGNADGVAVFNVPVGSITSSTVPVDAIFYGSAIGGAAVNAGADGYQLPVNDRYNGGKLQTTSFFAGDPASDQTIKASGFFNTNLNSWFGQRAWSLGTFTNDNSSSVSIGAVNPPGTASISTVTQTAVESAGSIVVNVDFANANTTPAIVVMEVVSYSTAQLGTDFAWTVDDTLVIPANSNGTFPFSIQLLDDAIAERTEQLIVKLKSVSNAGIATNNFQIIHLTDNDYVAPVANNELKLNLLNSFSNGAEGTNSAEIVSFDPTTNRIYIANSIGGKIDIVDLANPAVPVLLNSISILPYGNINSIAVHNGIIAAAVENSAPQQNGKVVFFDGNGVFLSEVTVGAMPDMITFNNDFTKVVVACEGEPDTDYVLDPEGSIGIVDITGGVAAVTNANVTIANFNAYNGQEVALRAQGIRIFGPGSNASQDFEPEYITISDDNTTAYVSLQENNAMAVVNLTSGTVTAIRPLGLSDYSAGNEMDFSDQTAGVFISSIPVKGVFMPDAIAHATIGGTEYIFSANEGDAREFNAVNDVKRLGSSSLDATLFPDQNILKHNQFLGRLNIIQKTGDNDNDGDLDEIQVFGGRSFSIWDAATGALVFDSKDMIEQIISTDPTFATLFNASNSAGAAVSKNRSDDKGPEPEGVASAFINGNHYLFVSLERVGGVMAFNVDVPTNPRFVGYYNNRDFATNGPDRGSEGIIVIKKEDSPTGKDIVILANEVSSTLSIFEVSTCVELAGATITTTTDSICENTVHNLVIPGNAQSSFQWLKDNQAISGETGTSVSITETGDYRVFVSNTALACSDTTTITRVTVLPLPLVSAGINQTVCSGDTITLSGSGAITLAWNNSVVDGVSFVPATTSDYVVTGTDVYGCQQNDTVSVIVNSLPLVSAGIDQTVCAQTSVTLTATGADQYTWNNSVSNGVAFAATQTGNYIVTGTDVNGCVQLDTLNLTVNPLPNVNLGNDTTTCTYYAPIVLNAGSGYTSYAWNNAATTSTISVNSTGLYSVSVTDANGCVGTDVISVMVNECLGLNESTIETSVYPNPSTGITYVDLGSEQPSVIQLTNELGQIVLQKDMKDQQFEVDLSGLSTGNYILSIQTSNGISIKRIQLNN